VTSIKMRPGAPGAQILGLGAYRPRRRVTNDELAQTMDTNDEWIQTRVGIAERRWASEDETPGSATRSAWPPTPSAAAMRGTCWWSGSSG
jgi:hypothetical protein